MPLDKFIKQRIAGDAKAVFAKRSVHQACYIAGAEAEAERAELLYDCLLKIRNNIYTAGAVNKKIDETLTKYNNSK